MTCAELDTEIEDPLGDISELFNDVSFTPELIDILRGGVTMIVINSLNPAIHLHERDRLTWQKKSAEFQSEYSTALQRYENIFQCDPDYFIGFINRSFYYVGTLLFRYISLFTGNVHSNIANIGTV